ncbi:Gfo/Idh/MocA family oxidoreductase [Paenibacillus glycanilyticus]|uniref:Gfo/Idh/MocA family protein n=1 Tax=Paenibacillus glycanilyticus TaxID=126569 RepID=UPI00203B00E9|nr:Gfo/Idh/MocA family oxidoreductase [Paenibacillus glycanilyticus]MCM3626132.1 Gfo/Idh/MocA family oxidoreductase [Paenibacillus glycanilyticus]
MKVWKIGLVGAGWWSEKHLKAWRSIPGAEVVALCDLDEARLKAKAEEFGVSKNQLYRSMSEMLEKADIDIVDIVTVPDTHLELVRAAATSGKHILCQKPFATSMREAEEMVQIAKEAGVRLMVTENWRWLQPFQLIKKAIEAGTLGTLHSARYIHTDYYTPRMEPGTILPQPFFRGMPKLLFFEMGPHWFDTWRFLFGTPKRLYAETLRVSPHIAGEDSGIVTMGYDHFYGYLDASWATRQKLDRPLGTEVGPVHLEQLVIDGSEATLKMYTSGQISMVGKDGSREHILAESTELDHEESHIRLQSHFVECLRSGAVFQTEGSDNLITLSMVFGVYESAAKHEPVIIGGKKP